MYKKSKYNVEILQVQDKSMLIYNSFTTSLCILDELTMEFYNNIDSMDSFDENPLFESLFTNGFIVLESTDEESIFMNEQIKLRSKSNTLYLTIAPTLNCNMDCKYCFEKELKVKSDMSPTVMNQTIKFVKEKIKESEFEVLQVAWYGGEPLLNLDTIIELSNAL